MELSEQDKKLRNKAVSRAKQRLSLRYAQEYRETLIEECEKLGIKPPKEHGSTLTNLELERKIARLERLLENQKLDGKRLECDFCGWDTPEELKIGTDGKYRCSVHTCEICKYEGYARGDDKGSILCDHHALNIQERAL
jgi:hypothetical protein